MKSVLGALSVSVTLILAPTAHAEICGRDPFVVEKLEKVIKKPCAQISDDDLGLITKLSLGGLGIKSLKGSDLAGLTSLEELYLEKNRLTELPDDLLQDMPNLTRFFVDSNQIASISSRVLSGHPGLSIVNLSNNELTTLPPDLFKGLPALTGVGLEGNHLQSLPQGLFSGLTSMTSIYLGANELVSLPDGAFSGLHALQTLDISWNKLTTLPPDVLQGGYSLNFFGFYDNPLTTLPDGLFRDCSSLKQIWGFETEISSLPEGIFEGLTGLTELDLSFNKLSSLPPGIFRGKVPRLQSLFLDGSGGFVLSGDMLKDLASLKRMSIDGAALVGEAVQNTALKHLLVWLTDDTTALPDGMLSGLQGLESVEITGARCQGGYSAISTLPEGLFRGPRRIQLIAVSYTQVSKPPEALFQGLPSTLATIQFFANHLSVVPMGLFQNLPSVKTVALTYNDLTSLQVDMFKGSSNIKDLFLNNNKFSPEEQQRITADFSPILVHF